MILLERTLVVAMDPPSFPALTTASNTAGRQLSRCPCVLLVLLPQSTLEERESALQQANSSLEAVQVLYKQQDEKYRVLEAEASALRAAMADQRDKGKTQVEDATKKLQVGGCWLAVGEQRGYGMVVLCRWRAAVFVLRDVFFVGRSYVSRLIRIGSSHIF